MEKLLVLLGAREKKKSRRSGSHLKRCSNIFFTRCGLSSTYHLVPLASLQYDTKPTRQYNSIMLIHDSFDRGVFGQMLHPSTIFSRFYVPPDSCEPAAASSGHGLLGAHPLSLSGGELFVLPPLIAVGDVCFVPSLRFLSCCVSGLFNLGKNLLCVILLVNGFGPNFD